jgi:arabinan endo-1,5-alpha-L-arabinosidase
MMRPVLFLLLAVLAAAQTPAPPATSAAATPPAGPAWRNTPMPAPRDVRLADERLRDSCVWVDVVAQTYYLVSAGRRGPNGRPTVVQYTSKDLQTWNGPRVIFEIPENLWTKRAIWAPELHAYKGKFYLFLTFDSDQKFPEQWRDWLPRVKRGSQVLVADRMDGPFQPFDTTRSTLPEDMMTLDGTLWVEDGVPYMVFCHEWVQIKDGTVECVRLKDDLSATVGEPVRLFHGSDAPWPRKSPQYGCTVTDGPWLYRMKSGKLAMVWSSGGPAGYTTGLAISDSGKLAGPWRQQAEPVFGADGGHAMLFRRLDGQLMMILHQPNIAPRERAVILEMEDTGETIRVKP